MLRETKTEWDGLRKKEQTKLKEKLAKDLKDIFQKYDKNICRYC